MDLQNSQKINIIMTLLSPYLSKIILRGNGVTSPTKKNKVTEWIKTSENILPKRLNLVLKTHWWLRVKEQKKIFQANGNPQKSIGNYFCTRRSKV